MWSAQPRLGTTPCLSFPSPAPAGISLLLVGLGPPLFPASVFRPPLVCRPAFGYPAPLLAVPGTGAPPTFCLSIPQAPQLVGLNLVLQGLAPDPSGCAWATDGLGVTVQP